MKVRTRRIVSLLAISGALVVPIIAHATTGAHHTQTTASCFGKPSNC
jgi:hypothetical protein